MHASIMRLLRGSAASRTEMRRWDARIPPRRSHIWRGPILPCKRASMEALLDTYLDGLTRDQLVWEVKSLRTGIRAHRDGSGHDRCWHHPQLRGPLPEKIDPAVAVPPWLEFLRGCIAYREIRDREIRGAAIADVEYDAS